MAGIDLLSLKPHQVSRDLSGYITYIYGAPKVGKTTLGSEMPKPLLLAFERGYNALGGIIAQDITSWAEVKQVVRELKKPEVKETFSTIIVDTVDVAANYCEKYVCNQNGVDAIGAIPYGQGWGLLKKEFEDVFRTITQLGYAVYFIAHYKEGSFKKQDGFEYSTIRPSVTDTYNKIIENMADIYGYMYVTNDNGEVSRRIRLRSEDDSVRCGSRFKYIAPEIGADYKDLVKALNDAIDKEAQTKGAQFVTNEKNIVQSVELDYDELMGQFNNLIDNLVKSTTEEDFTTNWSPRIVQITEKYLGKGKKVSQCTRDQAEMLKLIVVELEDLVKSK